MRYIIRIRPDNTYTVATEGEDISIRIPGWENIQVSSDKAHELKQLQAELGTNIKIDKTTLNIVESE